MNTNTIDKQNAAQTVDTPADSVALAAPDPMEARVAKLSSRMDDLEILLLSNPQASPEAPPVPPVMAEPAPGIDATMVGGMFNCPECGLRIIGPSLTAIQGAKGAYYEHPFEESPKLQGQKCRLIGQKFKSPVIRLEMVNPQALTPAKQ